MTSFKDTHEDTLKVLMANNFKFPFFDEIEVFADSQGVLHQGAGMCPYTQEHSSYSLSPDKKRGKSKGVSIQTILDKGCGCCECIVVHTGEDAYYKHEVFLGDIIFLASSLKKLYDSAESAEVDTLSDCVNFMKKYEKCRPGETYEDGDPRVKIWHKNIMDSLESKKEKVLENLRAKFFMQLASKLVEPLFKVTVPEMLPGGVSVAEQFRQEQISALLGNTQLVVLTLNQLDPSAPAITKAAFQAYGGSYGEKKIVFAPYCIAAYFVQREKSTFAVLPEGFSTENPDLIIETVTALYDPYAGEDNPYSNLQKALDAALSI